MINFKPDSMWYKINSHYSNYLSLYFTGVEKSTEMTDNLKLKVGWKKIWIKWLCTLSNLYNLNRCRNCMRIQLKVLWKTPVAITIWNGLQNYHRRQQLMSLKGSKHFVPESSLQKIIHFGGERLISAWL